MDADILVRCSGDVRPIELAAYPDGMPLIADHGMPADVMLLRPRSLAAFFSALWYVEAMRDRGVKPPRLILPAMPGARQDRLNQSGAGDVLFTAKSVSRAINAVGFPEVVLLDPHSDVTPALVERAKVWTAADCLRGVDLPAYEGVISPDAGAVKRASGVASLLKVPLYHGWKRRDVSTGALAGFGCERLPKVGGRYLVVDDLCDAGGTFVGLARALPDSAILDLYVTHGLFTKGTTELRRWFANLYTTDSVLGTHDATVLPVSVTLLRGGLSL